MADTDGRPEREAPDEPLSRTLTIRPAAEADLPTLQEIERSAGLAFRDVGMTAIAEDEPPSLDELRAYRQAGLAWIATNALRLIPQPDDAGWPPADESVTGRPVAYLVAEVVDGSLHIEQVSVHADYARRGIGRALIEHAARYAKAHGMAALTTFVDVPWNAPYYERCGFHRLPEDALTPGLRAIHHHEAELGLAAWPRTCMRRDL